VVLNTLLVSYPPDQDEIWAFLASQSTNSFTFEDPSRSYYVPSANDLTFYATVNDSNYSLAQQHVGGYHQWIDSTVYGQTEMSNLALLHTYGATRILNDGIFDSCLPPLLLSASANFPQSSVSNIRPWPSIHLTLPSSAGRDTCKPSELPTPPQLAAQPTAATPYQISSELRIDPNSSASSDSTAALKQQHSTISDIKRKRGVGDAVRLSCRHWDARRLCANSILDSDARKLG
jgi:hypothetical protein